MFRADNLSGTYIKSWPSKNVSTDWVLWILSTVLVMSNNINVILV